MSKSREKHVSKEKSPGREPLNSTKKIYPTKRPQHPKPPYTEFFAKYRKNPEQGIGPFRVDPTKKSYTVKRTPTTHTKYKGVKSFNEKPKIKSFMEPVENIGDTDSKSSNSSKCVYPCTRRPIVSNLSTNRGPIIPMEPVENATRTDSIKDGIHYSTDSNSNSKVITHSTPNKKTQRKKGRNKTRKSKSRAKHI